MKILLYGINYAPELTGIGKYSGEMCEWLADNGHEVRVVCAPPYYPEWKVSDGYSGWRYTSEERKGVVINRCPLFVPKQPRTLSRLVHLLSFALSSLPVIFKQWRWKPDAVICIEPTFFCTPAALLFSKARGCESMLHIQDFELDAMLGLGLGGGGVTGVCKAIERRLMRGFDIVSSISYSMLSNAEQKTGQPEKLFYFPNWVDTVFLSPDADASLFRRRWGIDESKRVILYSGNMGKKQGLEILLQAAEKFKHVGDVLFVLVGAGAVHSELKQMAEQLGLDNLRFYPLQPYEDLPALMALADVHLVIQRRGAADVVLPSKLSTILAVGGQSIITADSNTELGLLCSKYPGIARCIEPENAGALVAELVELLGTLSPKVQGSHNMIARQFAMDNLEKNHILTGLVRKLSD